jgi:hypothetical protein
MGVRDWRIYVLALVSVPMLDSLANGQPDAVFALAGAMTWRYRDSWPGGIAAGSLIAAKLLAWPLVIWLLVTRRFTSLAVTLSTAIALLLGSWACIGFKGLAQYPSLLVADARAFETWPSSYSLTHAIAPLGLSSGATRVLAASLAAALACAIIAFARRQDQGWFAAAIVFGLLSSPILWPHYLVVLFVPLVFAGRRRLTIWIAALTCFWLSMLPMPSGEGRAILVPLGLTALAIFATRVPSPHEAEPTRAQPQRTNAAAAPRNPVVRAEAGTA